MSLLAVVAFVIALMALLKARKALAEVAVLQALLAARAGPPASGVERPSAELPTAELPAAPPLVEPASEPIAEPAAELWEPEPIAAPAPARPRLDIELLLTQRWGLWLGAVAILLAGVFLVRTALDEGWFGPAARCVGGAVLGLLLVAAAQALRRRPAVALPFVDQAPAALAAGGVGLLLVSAYGAGPLYGLVPPPIAFVLMAAAALGGLALSLLFGRLVGAVGLVAAFVTPALVQTDNPSLPGLFAYLLLVSAASWTVVRLTAWTWLGWAAAAGGAAWVLFATTLPSGAPLWSPGLFIPAAAALTLALLPAAALEGAAGRRFAWAPMLLLGLAGLVLVGESGDPVVRAGLLLLGPVAMAKAWVEPRLAWLPGVAAAIGLLTLLAWAIPVWVPTAEAVTIEGVVQAVLPGAWAPDAILPFLQTAAAAALLYAAAGLWGERRSPEPLPWAALTAAVPVLVLAVAYTQVGRFQSGPVWALVAAALAAALVGAAQLARQAASIQRAGVHAAGAVAALALGFAIVLDTAWLTVALALLLPALAWIEGAAGLPALRRVGLVVAGVVLARLVLNPWVIDYDVGSMPGLNLLLVAYGIPAVCFGTASRVFRRRGDDLVVAVLEAGACAFVTFLVVLEVHQAFHGRQLRAGSSFAENAWVMTAVGTLAVLLQGVARGRGRPVLDVAWRVVGALALVVAVELLLANPFIVVVGLGPRRLLNALLPAYLLPAVLALLSTRGQGRAFRITLASYALVAMLMWTTAAVRQAFHPGTMLLSLPHWTDAELWSLSGAWLALAVVVMAAGFGSGRRTLRLVGLGLIGLVVAKVFLVDLAGLTGLWRVASFLGLGLSLIGLGAIYRRFGVQPGHGIGASGA